MAGENVGVLSEADAFARDLRHLIVCDTQFGWSGSTTLQSAEIEQLISRGWLGEGSENGEYDVTDAGHAIIAARLRGNGEQGQAVACDAAAYFAERIPYLRDEVRRPGGVMMSPEWHAEQKPSYVVRVTRELAAYETALAALSPQPAPSASEPMEMRICELRHVILKRDRVYVFTVDPNCEKCREVAQFGHQPVRPRAPSDAVRAHREQQSVRVMPLIGAFLDAYDHANPDDTIHESGIRPYVAAINAAMEGDVELILPAPSEQVAASGAPVSETTQAVIDLLRQRDAAGRAKYGTTLDRTDLSHAEWLQHMAEELLDGAGYALAARRTAAGEGT